MSDAEVEGNPDRVRIQSDILHAEWRNGGDQQGPMVR